MHAHTFYRFSSLEGIAANYLTVNISIDNRGRLTTDNGEVRNVDNDWQAPEHFTLARNLKFLIIKAQNDPGNVGGILASLSNNVVTDVSWECADMKGCQTSCSDGSSEPEWRRAVTYGKNEDTLTIWHKVNGGKLNGIESKAYWIWVKDRTATDVWCKKTFGKLYTSSFKNSKNFFTQSYLIVQNGEDHSCITCEQGWSHRISQ